MSNSSKEKSFDKKREKEKQVVSLMIRLFCRKKHGTKNGLCPECAALAKYACERSDKCPFMENKTFCSNCQVHCYKPEMREKIREVMRFSGPRMIFYHPVMAIRHVLETKKEAKEMAKKEDRFKVIYKDGGQLKEDGVRQILVDTETGVNYLVWKSGYAGGITPLLDAEGKVVITSSDA